MKLLLIFVFCFFSFCVFGQVRENKNPWTTPLPDTLFKKFKGNNNELLQQQLQDYLQRNKQQNQLLANKKGNVALLPQDHMPCIIPDTNAIVSMPNAWGGITNPYGSPYNSIPNPALPPQSFKYNAPDNSFGPSTK
jgi:hypothetical protein